MIKKSILFSFGIGIGLFITACGSNEISTDTSINQNQVVLETSQSSNETTQLEKKISETSSKDNKNSTIDYSYVDIVFNSMDIWNEYEGTKPSVIEFFTYRSTGDTGIVIGYIVNNGMAVQRNYFFQNDTIVLDEDASVLQGGIYDESYQLWNNSATDEEKYEQLKSIYDGYLDKKTINNLLKF